MNIFDPHITGSLSVSASAEIQGDLTVQGTIYGTAQIDGSVDNAISASHAASYLLTSSFNDYKNTAATTGSNVFIGDQTISGSLLPQGTLTHDLGSDTKRWNDIYLAGSTIDLGGTKITKNSDGDVQLHDSGNTLKRLIASEIELGHGSNKKVLKVNNGRLKLMATNDSDEELAQLSGSFTGSFRGDGSGLINVPASGVTGLSLDRIASTSATASISSDSLITNVSIIPSITNTIDLGAPDKEWRDLYLSSGSLYINGQQVLSTTGTELRVTTDSGESIKILETGSDTITLQTVDGDITLSSSGTGNIELDAPIQITSGNKIISSDGNSIVFGNGMIVTGSIELTGTVDGVDVASLNSDVEAILSSSEADKNSFAEIVGLINSVDTENDESFAAHYTASNNRLSSLETTSGSHDGRLDSLETFSTNINTTIKSKLNTENVVSGSEFKLNESSPITQYVDVKITQISGVYYIDGIQRQTISLAKGLIYRFDVSDSSVSSHPFRFSTDSNNQTQYTNGVTTSGSQGSSGSYVQIVVNQDTPSTIYYYCTNHGGMGGKVFVGGAGDTDGIVEGSGNLYYTDARVKTKLNTETVISSSIQVDITGTTNYNLVDGRLDSVESFTASIDDTYATDTDVTTLRTDLNTYTSSNDSTNTSQNNRLDSIESETGSYLSSNNLSDLEGRADSLESFTASIDNTYATDLDVTNLRGDLNTYTSSNDSTNTSQNNRLGSLETKTGSLNTDISNLRGDLNTYTSSNETDKQGLNNRLDSLETKSGSLDGDISGLDGRVDSLESFTASIDDTYATDTDVTNLSNRLDSVETKTGSLDTTNTTQNNRLDSIETKTGSLNIDVSNLEGRADSLESFTASIDDTYATDTDVTTLRNDLNTYTSSNNTTNTNQDLRLVSLETESGSIRTTFNSYTSSNDSTNTTQNNRLNSIETTSGSHDGRLDSLETKTGSLNGDITGLDGRLDTIEGGLEFTGSNVTIKGDLLVKGTETRVDSTTVEIGDNIISLNGSGAQNAGIEVRDNTSPDLLSGSLIWDGQTNYWKGGQKGSEERLLDNTDLTTLDSRLDGIEAETGSYLTDYNDEYTTGATFNTGDGKITFTRNDGDTYTVDLDGRFLDTRAQIHSELYSTNGDANDYTEFGIYRNYASNGPISSHNTILHVSQTDGNYGFQLGGSTVVNGDGLYFRNFAGTDSITGSTWYHIATRDWVGDQNYLTEYNDEYTTGATFNTGNGVITFKRNDGDTYTVDIDGRFLTSYSETDTLDSVADRGSTTDQTLTMGGIVVTGASATATSIKFNESGTDVLGIRYSGNVSGNPLDIYNFQSSSLLMRIMETGVTTFSNSVTASSFIKNGGTSSQFLKADGSVDSNTYLTQHPPIASPASSNNSGRTYIQDILLDGNGHVTGLTTATETVTDSGNDIDYISSATFNTGTGVITGVGVGNATFTVDIDGRFVKLGGDTMTGTLTVPTIQLGSTSFSRSGDQNHVHFVGTALIPNTTTTSSNSNMGTSAYRWKGVYGGLGDFSGTVTASGGNSGNWNTAYGWGDHSTEGYITGYSETDTLDSVTDRGSTTSNVLTVGGVNLNDGDSIIEEASGDAFRFKTSTGYIDIGSKNSGWIHFEGNRPYYFGTSYSAFDGDVRPYTNNVRSLGSSSYRWSIVNSVLGNFSGVVTALDGTSTNWNTAYGWGDHSTEGYVKNDEYTTGATWNGGTGIVTFTRNDGDQYSVDISSALSEVTVTGGTYNDTNQTLTLTKSDGTTVNVTGFALDNTNNFTTGATFNSGDGIVTGTLNGGATWTVDIDGRYLPLSGGTISSSNTHTLKLENSTNGLGTGIEFSDNPGNGTQRGYITHYHGDGSSYGSGASIILSTNQSTMTILADGKLMYKEGIYSKPATGTGAGTRKDSNWDTAYGWGDHSQVGYITGFTNTNEFVTGATFNTGDGKITFTRNNGGDTFNVDIDGRFSLTSHNHDDRYFQDNKGSISLTGGNPFDDSKTETRVTGSGSYVINYTGASAHLFSSNVGGSASIFQIGAHYNGSDFYMRTRTDGSTWQTWKQLWHSGDFTSTNISNWNTAYGWGDHSVAGYTGDQDLSGYLLNTTDTFTGALTINGDIRGAGQHLILNAGESYAYATGQGNEYVYVNAEQGLEVNSETGNWVSGWAARKTALLRGDLLRLDGEDLTKTNIQNFKTAYGWGDHSQVGYITGFTNTNEFTTGATFNSGNGIVTFTRNNGGDTFTVDLDGRYLQLSGGSLSGDLNMTGTNPMIKFVPTGTNDGAGIRFNYSSNDGVMEFWTSDDYSEPFIWRAYDVGLDGTGNYQEWMKLYQKKLYIDGEELSKTNIQNFKTAYGWGDHSTEGYVKNDEYTTGGTLNNGIITFTRNDGDTYTVDISPTLVDVTVTGGTYNSSNQILTLTKSNGSTVDVSGFAVDTDVNWYTTSATFNTSNGIITGTYHGGTWTVDIDGRYLTSESNSFLGDGGSANTHPGTNRVIFTGQVSAGSGALGMPTVDNSNAFLNINRHSGEYNSQLGFSSNGNIYYRKFSNTAINSTQAWLQVYHSGNFANNSGNWNTAYGWGDHSVAGYASGDFLPKSGGTMSGAINMNGNGINMVNGQISNVNHITIADPGPTEGIEWLGGNGFRIVESPNDLTTNSGGNLQFVKSSTRILTLGSNGQSEFTDKLTLTSSTSGSTIFDIQGTSGQLFSITDDLTGDLFAVSDSSGVPIFNVNASGAITIDPLGSLYVGNNKVINGNGDIEFDGPVTTSNQDRGIYWTSYDKEGTTDFSDTAHILHTTNSGGLVGSVIEIKSQNDATDGVNFVVNGNSAVRINGNIVVHAGNYTSYQQHPTITAATSSDNSGRTYIQDILLDGNGHVTGVTTATETVTDSGNDNDIDYISGATFDDTTGVITGTGVGNAGFTVDIDGRYLTTETYTAHDNITAAASSDNSGRTYVQDILVDGNGHVTGITTATETVTDSGNYYVDGLSFDTGNGVLTASVNGATNQTVDLDGRYLGTGDKAADSDLLDGVDSSQFLRADVADTATMPINFTGGHGAINITNSSILSSATSAWTGNPGGAGKIQYHSNRWYIVSDSSSNRIVQFRRDGSDKSYIDNDGKFIGTASSADNANYATTAGSADQIDGIPFRNTNHTAGINADTLDSAGITYYTAGVDNFSGNATDGALYSQIYSSSWQHQIAGDYRSGRIAVRGKNNSTWQSWKKIPAVNVSTFVNVSIVTFTHGLGTDNVIVQVYDSNGDLFFPSAINSLNGVVVVKFETSRSGRVVVTG